MHIAVITSGGIDLVMDQFEQVKEKITFIIPSNKKVNRKTKHTIIRLKLEQNNLLTSPLILKNILKGQAWHTDLPYTGRFKDLSRTLQNINPDIIVSNLFYKGYTRQAYAYAKNNHKRFWIQTEVKQFPESKYLQLAMLALLRRNKKMLNNTEYILPWTKDGAQFIKEWTSSKIKVLPAAQDVQTFKPTKVKKNGIIMIARFAPYKRHHDVLKALDALGIPLTLVGKGPIKSKIRELAKNYDIKVTYKQDIARSKIPALISKHKALVLASKNEAIGMVVPEAMACNVPVIVSDSSGAATYVDKSSGWIYPTGDVQALRKICKGVEKSSLQPRKRIMNFSRESIAKQIEELI